MVVMADVIPVQKMEDSALANVAETSWYAEWSERSTSTRSDGGMVMQSLYIMTPSVIDKVSFSLWLSEALAVVHVESETCYHPRLVRQVWPWTHR